ncbi:MAG: UDP-glucose 4-epimerase GalE [Phycisphaerales bacterium]|nr:UDP-glucose 4-epimerase GalE [Phycisphaerales bacterium]
MNVLVTGGAGYIGSHAALRLLEGGHAVTVIDDLSRGNQGAMDALEGIGGDFAFVAGDIGDRPRVESLLRERSIEVVMHFAALTYVGESTQQPLRYYRNNTASALALIEAMEAVGVRRMVFSSSAATYGEPPPELIPIREDCPQRPINPYGQSKLHVEQILADYARAKRDAGQDFAFASLRYFNVAGNDGKLRLGEDHDPETHLIPICLAVALGQRKAITIFGTDYPTPDGTCIRDYVHVEDLIDAHVSVMHALRPGDARAYNIGIGKGYSVREVIDACRRVTDIKFTEVEGKRREGDPPSLFADPSKIRKDLRWRASHTSLEKIIESAWQWRQQHPRGYGR